MSSSPTAPLVGPSRDFGRGGEDRQKDGEEEQMVTTQLSFTIMAATSTATWDLRR